MAPGGRMMPGAEGRAVAREILGRDAELRQAVRLLDAAQAEPLALVLGGEPGIGKTTVWRAVLERAEERGHRVLSARPVDSEATLAFAAVADLLRDGLEEALATLPHPQRSALEGALLRVDPPESPDPRAVAFGFYGSLLALARLAPLTVGIDDVQWLDAPSARVLEFALRRLSDVPVRIVLAFRTEAEGDLRPPLGLDRGPLEERTHLLSLRPLEIDVLRRILRSRLDIRLPQWTLARIHEASGGNPLLALELARALVRRDLRPRAGEALPIPRRLSELVSERLERLSVGERDVLVLTAAASRPTLASVSRALGDPPMFADDVEAAIRSDLIEISGDRIRFSNPLVQTVLYSESPGPERRRAHRLLADVAEDPEELARHLALAAEGPDERVAGILEVAAQRARSHGAPDAAAELAEMALTLTPPDRSDARVRRTSAAGRYAFESGHIERAEELLQQAGAEAPSGPARAEALLYLSRVRYHRRDARSAGELAEQALRQARDDPSLQASITLELAAASELSGDHHAARSGARRALRLAERSGDRIVTAEALALTAFYGFLAGKGVATDQIARAMSLVPEGRPVRPLRSPGFYRACMLMWADDLDAARSGLHELERHARDEGDEGSLSVLLFLLAQIEAWSGGLTEAARLADESHALAGWTGQRIYLVTALYARSVAAGLLGETDRARRLGQESLTLAQQIGMRQGEVFARTALGSLELSRGDARAADGWLRPLVSSMDHHGPTDPGTLRFLPDAMEVLIGLDEVERAEALLEPFEARARRLGRAWALGGAARCRGLLLASRREFLAALEAFDRAVEHHQVSGQPLEPARTHLAKGRVLRRAKQWGAARGSLGRSLSIFEELGASLWADTARSELARIGGRAPYLGTLTETEERVAELVATGLTNREVAARLFLSVSTVESNLRRAYRKLGVRSRVELSRRLSEAGTPTPS